MTLRRTIVARLRARSADMASRALTVAGRASATNDLELASAAVRELHAADLIRRFADWLDPDARGTTTARANAPIERGQAVRLDPNGGVSPIGCTCDALGRDPQCPAHRETRSPAELRAAGVPNVVGPFPFTVAAPKREEPN